MYAFAPSPSGSPDDHYAELHCAARALIDGETDAIANMANIAALIWQFVPDLNWAGFYRRVGDALVLGPFIGKPACIRIAIGQGVCGTALARGETQIVADVHAFPGHIACDADSRSELVVPLIDDAGQVHAVLDLDSPTPARFGDGDARALERLLADLAAGLRQT